jgi:transcriptional antiterminator RfaH
MKNFYCVNTASRCEPVAKAKLEAAGIEVLLPQYREVQINEYGGRREYVRPLFPGYLFAECELWQYSLAASKARKEVLRLVSVASVPQIVDASVIDEIKGRIGPNGLVKMSEDIEIGQGVEITQPGPFCGLKGVFVRSAKSDDRIIILLQALSGPFTVPVYPEGVRALA